jgi:hypothetical protein
MQVRLRPNIQPVKHWFVTLQLLIKVFGQVSSPLGQPHAQRKNHHSPPLMQAPQ